MKANEFVKKFGWDEARHIAEYSNDKSAKIYNLCGGLYSNESVSVDDIKRLIDSYDFVEVGLPELKKQMFDTSKSLEYVKNWILTVSEKTLTKKGIKLKQAIADVESCQ